MAVVWLDAQTPRPATITGYLGGVPPAMITGIVHERSAARSACAWSSATKIASTDTRICIHLRQEHRAPVAVHNGGYTPGRSLWASHDS
jgi:hypothetical protein